MSGLTKDRERENGLTKDRERESLSLSGLTKDRERVVFEWTN